MSSPVKDALVSVQHVVSAALNEVYSVEQTIETSERAEALIRVHASVAWTIGAYVRFGDSIDPVEVMRRMFTGGTAVAEEHRRVADLLELTLAAKAA